MIDQIHDEKREALKEAAIIIIAEQGLERVTTKELTTVAKTKNEAYIYRLFRDKHDLLEKMFDMLDHELVRAFESSLDIMMDDGHSYEDRSRMIFHKLWRFMLRDRQRCLAYIQYYYSPLYMRYSASDHMELFMPTVLRLGRMFKPECNMWRLANYMLDVILTMSIKIFRGEIEDTPEMEEKTFLLIYRALYPYLIWSDWQVHDAPQKN